MRITCDARGSMGYIYLINKYGYENTQSKSIRDQFDIDLLKIEKNSINSLNELFSDNDVMDTTYLDGIRTGDVIEEYLNDKLESGHFIGIELNLTKEHLFDLIEGRAFRFYNSTWKGNECFMVTFEKDAVLFAASNRIFPLTHERDTFIVCSPNKKDIGTKILAIISTRFDLYDTEYLNEVDFIVSGS